MDINSRNNQTPLNTEVNAVMTSSLDENMKYLNQKLAVNESFDLVYRVIRVGERNACIYFIDGFCKDELMQKMLQYFMALKEDELPNNYSDLGKFYNDLQNIKTDQNKELIISKMNKWH